MIEVASSQAWKRLAVSNGVAGLFTALLRSPPHMHDYTREVYFAKLSVKAIHPPPSPGRTKKRRRRTWAVKPIAIYASMPVLAC